MSWFSRFKNYLFRRSLERETAQQNRLGVVKNFDGSRFIGIWFDGRNRENFQLADKYAEKLAGKGKKVEVLGYVKKVKKDEEIAFDYLDPEQISWLGIPQQDARKLWADKPYDILICLHTNECKPLEYLAQVSVAKCKVGRYSENTIDCYDLMVSLGTEQELPQMIKQVDQLLNDINKNQTQNATAV